MPRILDTELQRLKEEVSVQRLVEAAGVALKKGGKDFTGQCPFHADATASLVITPHKNLWHCFGCQIGGGPIDWVMKSRGVSFRHAVELLKEELSGAGASLLAADAAGAAPVKRATVRTLPPPVALDAEDQALLLQTVDYYHQRLKQDPEALAYLASRGLDHPGLVDAFRLGVADRTLGLPLKNRAEGAAIRTRLQTLGIIHHTGHERYNGSLVVPIFNGAGHVVEIYGRRVGKVSKDVAKHMVLPAPEGAAERHRGVFNLAGVIAAGAQPEGQREVILCEALLDAMSFWCAGFTHVTSSYGVSGFGADILSAFKAHHIERVFIAYDRDEPGDHAADKLAAQLIAEGFEVLRVQFPQGLDANEFACTHTPAEQSLALVLRQALWVGGVRPVAQATTPAPEPSSLAAESAAAPGIYESNVPLAQRIPALPAPENVAIEPSGELPDELSLTTGTVSWRVRGWKKNSTAEAMKVNVQARVGADDQAAYFVDTLDLYAARSRQSFVRAASVELGLGEDALKRELGAVLLKLEGLQDALMAEAKQPSGPVTPILSAEEEAAALALLRAPDLMTRIVADLHGLGVVGEDLNLLAAYLAAVSRKLDAPLAVLIQSTSAAGKSSLMDAVLQLVPPEERIQYSAMTGQSLFYLGEHNLSHKILAIAEEEGVRQAAYALKLLQSDGELTIASTAKDEASGNLMTKQYTVRGPVMLMLTTTAIDVDEELLNRCLVLSVNESREQTAAIHARQRHKQTLAGLLQAAGKEAIQSLHHNAQRLLSSVAVVNPYADQLTFLADKTRTRRDHMKYLTLIRAITLLHQHQREVKTVEHRGTTLSYIEVTKADIALANTIAHEVLGRTLDELPPQTRRLLNLTRTMVQARAATEGIRPSEIRFTRKHIRDATQWSDNQLKVHCARLADMEYLLVHGGSRGHNLSYELLWDGAADAERHLCGLIEVTELEGDPPLRRTQVGVNAVQVGAKLAPSCAQVGVKLEGMNRPAGRASLEVQAATPLNGTKPRIRENSSLAAGPVVAMAH